MPRKEGTTSISIGMKPDELKRVNQQAKKKGFKITADYVRSLLEQDINAGFKFDVDRGGYRGDKDS